MPNPQPITINGRFLSQSITGVQRFGIETLRALDDLIERGDLRPATPPEVLMPPDTQTDLTLRHFLLRPVGRLHGNLWEQIDLPCFARGSLLFSPCNIGPMLHAAQVVVLHDASVCAVPEAYSRTFRLKYRIIMGSLLRTARQVLTVSAFSQRELAHYFHVSPSRLRVISEGHEHLLRITPDSGALERFGLQADGYMLAVGSSSPHKNLRVVIDALPFMNDKTTPLVIAGGRFTRVFQAAQDEGEDARIQRLGYVDEATLAALYRGAACFVFPSLYEGFGLPPLEAMTLECAVAAADIPALREVCGDAAQWFDPRDPRSAARALDELLGMPERRASLRHAGLQRAQQYRWQDTARAVAAALWSREEWEVGDEHACV